MTDQTPEISYLPTDVFIRDGYLQESNRLFFHPLGLALELSAPGGNVRGDVESAIELLVSRGYMVTRCWDYRDDPEGMVFADQMLGSAEGRRKADHVAAEHVARRADRESLLGWWIQPIPPDEPPVEPGDGIHQR